MSSRHALVMGARSQARRARNAWRRVRTRDALRVGYAAIHDGRTLNLFATSVPASATLGVYTESGEKVASFGRPSPAEDGYAWTVDVMRESLADGRYQVLMEGTASSPQRIDAFGSPQAIRADVAGDGAIRRDAPTVASLEAPIGSLWLTVAPQPRSPFVDTVQRRNDGTYDLNLVGVEPESELIARERNTGDVHRLGRVDDSCIVFSIDDLPCPSSGEFLWDLSLESPAGQEPLKVGSGDVVRPFGIMSIPGFISDGPDSFRYKPYVAHDGRLTVQVARPVEGESA